MSRAEEILEANGRDVAAAGELGLTAAQVDRLRLTPERLRAAAAGLKEVAALPEPAQEVVAGGAIVIQPGEKHWHGAAPGTRAVHIAVNVNAQTEWLEPVSEAQYRT